MLCIRCFEECCVEFYGVGKICGFLYFYIGEEVIVVGVMFELCVDDSVLVIYCEYGYVLVCGLLMDVVMVEMYGKCEGCSGGCGGLMYFFDGGWCFYGGNVIVVGVLLMVVGFVLVE